MPRKTRKTKKKRKDTVLFVYETWDDDITGLPAFHRDSVEALHQKIGKDLDIYCTVLDVKVTEKQIQDAKTVGVTLIMAKRDEYAKPKNDPITSSWLLYPNAYYPDLQSLPNVKYVVGYAPKTGDAAASIRKKLFPKAKLYLINHLNPEDPYLVMSAEDREELCDDMRRMASLADVMFSIGPGIFDYFDNAYRADYNEIKLSRLPHLVILPKPSNLYCETELTLPKEVNQHVILTFGQVDEPSALNKYKPVVSSIGNVAQIRKKLNAKPPKQTIHGVTSQKKPTRQEELSEKLKAGPVEPMLRYGYSSKALLTDIQQSHLCIIAACHDEYGMNGVEAMAAGIPNIIPDGTQMADFIRTYFPNYESCIVENEESEWEKKIIEVITDIDLAFGQANAFKKAYLANDDIKNSHDRFADYFLKKKTAHSNNGSSTVSVNVTVETDQHSQDVEQQDKGSDPESVRRTSETLERCQGQMKRKVDEILEDDEQSERVQKVVKSTVGEEVTVTSMTKGSLTIVLDLPSPFFLYRLQACCHSGLLAHKLEPLLLTDEMREEAVKVGRRLKLRAEYDKDEFAAVDKYFLEKFRDSVKKAESPDLTDSPLRDPEVHTATETVALSTPGHQELDLTLPSKLVGQTPSSDVTLPTKISGHRREHTDMEIKALYLEVNPMLETKRSAIKEYFTMVHAAQKCYRMKGRHHYVIRTEITKSPRIKHILHSKHDILKLLGIQKYLWSDVSSMLSATTALEKLIAKESFLTTDTTTMCHSTITTCLLPFLVHPKQFSACVRYILHTLDSSGEANRSLLQNQVEELVIKNETLQQRCSALTGDLRNAEIVLVKEMKNRGNIQTELETKTKHNAVLQGKISELKNKLSAYSEQLPSQYEEGVDPKESQKTETVSEELEDSKKDLKTPTLVEEQLTGEKSEELQDESKGPDNDEISEPSEAEKAITEDTDIEVKDKPVEDIVEGTRKSPSDKARDKEPTGKDKSPGVFSKLKKFFTGKGGRKAEPHEIGEETDTGGEKADSHGIREETGGGKAESHGIGEETDKGKWKHKSRISVKSPYGLTITHLDQLVVACPDDYCVKTFTSEDELEDKLTLDGQFPKPFEPWAVAVSPSNIYYIGDHGNLQVVVYNKATKTVQTFCHGLECRAIALIAGYFFVLTEKKIVKCDTDSGLIESEVKGRIKPGLKLINLQDLSVDRDNNVIVSDCGRYGESDGKILLFDSSLTFLRTVVTELWKVWGISTDRYGAVYTIQYLRESGDYVIKYRNDGSELDRIKLDNYGYTWIAVSKVKQHRLAVSYYALDRVDIYAK